MNPEMMHLLGQLGSTLHFPASLLVYPLTPCLMDIAAYGHSSPVLLKLRGKADSMSASSGLSCVIQESIRHALDQHE